MSQQDTRQDIRTLVELLRLYEGETIDIDDIAATLDWSWGQTYNNLLLIREVARLAPELGDIEKGTLPVGANRWDTSDIFEDDVLTVLAYFFVHTRTIDPLDIDTHSTFIDAHEDAIEEARDHEFLEYDADADTLALTPKGIGLIGPQYSRSLHVEA